MGAAEDDGELNEGMSEAARTMGAACAARVGRVDEARTNGRRWMREEDARGEAATRGAMRWRRADIADLRWQRRGWVVLGVVRGARGRWA